ncbi:bifunctional diguanylate cyclase/phosphodiesterase [Pelagibacterium lentulum]|uniref:Diguanylate cyclase n=1 Tax=Pelagibacterium lentulum TaxID=2029865 RepID=A0A916W3K4_9HYPH|nr:EAL domain-containing protein [Pelagibacterium lentulum]GGA63097.1 diguanylate cyclase [Pelagibacterium lentulum]
MANAIFRSSYIPTAIALVVTIAAGIFADIQNRAVYEQSQRTHVLDKVSLIRARLEGKVTSNIQLVHGLVSTITTEPGMSQARYENLASYLFSQPNELLNVAAAPDLVVNYVYPREGNEAAIGLDYSLNAQQREAALQARDTGALVLAGPVQLVQGGRGFIGRFPVFARNVAGQPYFWGIVSAVIDADRLYAEAGLLDPDLDIDIAITGHDGTGASGNTFFGNPEVRRLDPVIAEVGLPTGSWIVSATPRGGWGAAPPNTVQLWAMIAIASALVLLPILMAGRLSEERRKAIAEQRHREAELARLSRRLELALATSQVGVWDMNIFTGELSWDDRMNEIYGLPTDGGMREYHHWSNRLHPDDLARAQRDYNEAIRANGRYVSNFRVITPQGETRHIRAIGAVSKDMEGEAHIVGVNWDVTTDAELNEALVRAKTQAEAKNIELETAKARIEHNALHDSLTGLPNRRYLDDILEMHAKRGQQGGGSNLAILHIDLDRFKQINDTLGHAAGDAMLIHAAEILKASVRQSDFVARIGGDEFVVLCLGEKSRESLRALAERIIEAMRQPVMYKGHECRIGSSIGIASGQAKEIDPKQVLVNADIALYRAKGRGRNRCEFFSDELQAEIITTKRVADDILNGIENREFVAYYQPQFDAKTLDIIGVEALVRWNHPLRGLLTPNTFLSIAEDLNVVATLDRIMLEQSLSQLTRWRDEGLEIGRASVNVSARRLHDEHLVESLRKLSIDPGTISFELVESIYLDESENIVNWNIDQIRDMGIDIEIDDFGTGHTSIVSLLQLRPSRLKIDRQIIEPITTSHAQRSLVRSIIEIGRSLGIEAVAEGVETLDQAVLLRDMGCHSLQGYAFARPMSAEALTAFVKENAWRNAG